eukprot:6197875-Pleurochrysis_carterae.AAC.1
MHARTLLKNPRSFFSPPEEKVAFLRLLVAIPVLLRSRGRAERSTCKRTRRCHQRRPTRPPPRRTTLPH